MANVAYVRVSSVDQNESRQIEALEKYNISKWFKEKVSGKNIKDRQMLLSMLDWVREGDTVYVLDFSRLARSTKDLLQLIERMKDKQVRIVSLKENFDTNTPTGKLMLTMMAAINEFERQNLLERQKEGIAIAKRKGKYKGRTPIKIDEEVFNKYYDEYMNRKINKVEFSHLICVSRPTLDKLLREKRNDATEP